MLNDVSDVHCDFAQLVVGPDWGRCRPAALLPRRVAEIAPFFSPVRNYDVASKRFTIGSYSLSASARSADPRFFVMTIVAGKDGEDARNPVVGNQVSISLKILDGEGDEDVRALAAVKPILLALISTWEPERASVVSKRYGQLAHAAGDATPFVHGTWAAYFAGGAAEVSLTSLGIARRLPDGGLLWCATEEAFDLDNPVHLGAAAAMHAALSRK
jgi:hypothetical protein